MNMNVHAINSIDTQIKELDKGNGRLLFVRDIILKTRDGEMLELTLYSDTKKDLDINEVKK